MVERSRPRAIPAAVGTLLLGIIVLAGLLPNVGTVQAQSSCPYGGCTTSAVPAWEIASIVAVVAAVVVAVALVVLRRRRTPRGAGPAAAAPAAVAGPLQPWQEGPETAEGPGGAGTPPPAAAPYLEGPEDVGHAPPTLTPPPKAAGAPAAAAAAAPPAAAGAEGEADIDSLMAELDRISGEILKKSPKKGSAQKPAEPTEENEPPS